jgi:hypothetical protein
MQMNRSGLTLPEAAEAVGPHWATSLYLERI